MDTQLPPTLSAPVLGQLLLMQSVLGQLPNEPAIFSFVCRGLQDLPGVAEASYAAAAGEITESALVRFPLRIGASQWGELVLKLSDPSAFAPYELYLKNFCFTLTVLLEERQQRRLNEQHQAQLEQRVQERTRQLTKHITERKRAEESLRKREADLQLAQQIGHIGSWEVNLASDTLQWSQETYRIFGCNPDTFTPSNAAFFKLVHASDHERVRQAAAEAVRTGGDYQIEHRIHRPDGQERVVLEHARILRDPQGQAARMMGTVQDITERKRAEQEIQRQAAFARFNPNPVLELSADSEINYFNAAAGEMARTLGMGHPAQMLPPNTARIVRECLATGKPNLRMEVQTGQREISWSFFPVKLNNVVHCYGGDITERKKIESQFLRAQRMESIGTLAGGIAHDLNNVLTPILMSVAMLHEKVTDEEGRVMVTTVQASAQRGADLVRQVLAFARGVSGQRVAVNPIHIVRDIQKIIQETFPKNLDFSFRPGRDLWMVTGDPTQLHQVFMNLCVNARDAMPTGGKLAITMENIEVDEAYVGMNPESKPGAYVLVKVADTGPGIPAAIQNKVFEPFFTTKEPSKGTGLGLSTTLAIVRSHGGFISLYSEPGQGTQFKVYLPANITSQAAENAASKPTQLPRGHGELVLVADDEKCIRSVAKIILERAGYRVLLAVHGAEAVALYTQHQEEIAVVLSDMAMPIMDGPAAILAITAMNPRVKIIGSSGLSSAGGSAKAAGANLRHFLPKPYKAETMLKVLAEVLREP